MLLTAMPEVVRILKKRFPNLTAEEVVKLASDILEAVRGHVD
jgi:hypothetical protein